MAAIALSFWRLRWKQAPPGTTLRGLAPTPAQIQQASLFSRPRTSRLISWVERGRTLLSLASQARRRDNPGQQSPNSMSQK